MFDIELITWVDSYGCSTEWTPIDDIKNDKPLTCKSVGYVVSESPIYITIVPHLTDYNDVSGEQGCGDMTIPKVAILARTILVRDKIEELEK